MKQIIAVMVLTTLLSCSLQRKLSKAYIGKTIMEVEAELGEPKTILSRDDSKVYVFEKIEQLQSTEISQAKLTLDPMVTPKVTKTERYYFTVKNNVVTKLELENEYDR